MSGRARLRRPAGLTLIELLVALSILTVILGGVYSVFSTSARNLRTVEERSDLTQTARVVLGDLRRELGSVYPMQVPVDEEQAESLGLESGAQSVVSFAGEDGEDPDGRPNDNLRFTAAVGDSLRGGESRSDVAELMYLIDTDDATPETGLVKRRNFHPGLAVDEAQLETVALSPLATTFDVRYWVGDNEDMAAETEDGWADAWSDTIQLPQAVAVTLGLTPSREDAAEFLFRMVVRIPIRTPRPTPPAEGDAGGAGRASGEGETSEEAGGEGAAGENDGEPEPGAGLPAPGELGLPGSGR